MSLDRIWIRDSNGNPIELDSLWIRNQGAARKIGEVWVRNSSGIAEKVYPNTSEENDETTEIVIMNQGSDQQMPSLRFDQVFSGSWSTGMETLYRNAGVKFGLNTGVGSTGGSGDPGTLVTKAQENLTPIISAFLADQSTNPTTSFNWDWGISINIENGTSVQAVLRGGANETDIVPLNYQFFDRSGAISNETQQVINTALAYYPSATSTTITYQQLHNACKQANIDVATWVKAQAPSAKVMNWWKTAASPIPLIQGWWNNDQALALTVDGYPTNGVDTIYQRAASGRRTINGDQQYLASGTTVSLPSPTDWSYGFDSYPIGSYQARGTAVPFEMCVNSNGIQTGVDCVVHQSYFPVYPIERTLNVIPSNGYTSIGANDLTHGFDSSGTRYTKFFDAKEAVARTTRNNWLANWKQFGSKASIGTELSMDYAGFEDNRFNGLAIDPFDYLDMFINPIVQRVTKEEILRFGLPSDLVGKKLFPRYWVFWNAAYYFLYLLMTHGGGEGRNGGPGSDFATNTNARLRSRDNIRSRFQSRQGAPVVNWTEGSDWHGFVCQQLDVDGYERLDLVKSTIEEERLDP